MISLFPPCSLDLDESKYLCVSPLLNEEEKEKVRKQIDILNKR